MHIQDLRALLLQGVVRIVFLKTDNTERTLLATLHPSRMPPAPVVAPGTGGRALPEGNLLVWDTEANGLRSFIVDCLLEEPVLIEALTHET